MNALSALRLQLERTINFTPVPNVIDDDLFMGMIYRINYAVIPNPEAIKVICA
jgi:hypothetical protein